MYRFIKSFLDRLVALIALIIASPIIVLVVILLLVANAGKAFFVQPRPGLNGKIFKVIKFKTMNDKMEQQGNLLPDADRLTTVGKIVRKTSLDELPQLFNVLKGDMSFVGPRPLLVEYLPLYNREQAKRHLVKPGISGWAQVNGRNAISWEKKFELDVWYVQHQSFWLDLRIVFMTVINVLTAKGISGEGSATMEKFRGEKALGVDS